MSGSSIEIFEDVIKYFPSIITIITSVCVCIKLTQGMAEALRNNLKVAVSNPIHGNKFTYQKKRKEKRKGSTLRKENLVVKKRISCCEREVGF